MGSVINYLNDFMTKLCGPLLFKKDFGEENQKVSADIMEKIVNFLGKKAKLVEGKYLCGNDVTIADCFAAYYITTFFWNDGHPGGEPFTKAAQEHAKVNADFMEYAEAIKDFFKPYVEARGQFSV